MTSRFGSVMFVVVFLALMLMSSLAQPGWSQSLPRPANLGEDTAKAVTPFKIFDNLYYVGLDFVCAYVIQTSDGLILVDTLFGPFSDHTAKAMEELGLNPSDVQYIIVTHGHDDHYAGAKKMQELTGARVMMAAADWQLMEETLARAGESEVAAKRIPRDMIVRDGDTLTLGNTTVRLYVTPGHTPGTLSLEFPVFDNGRQHTVFMWAGPTLQSNDPAVMRSFLDSTRRVDQLVSRSKADVWLHSHPWSVSFFQKYERLKTRTAGQPNPYVNPAEIPVFLQQRIEDTEQRLSQLTSPR